jgi:ATP/maltotriose-dependent transcriptional regulator MalT
MVAVPVDEPLRIGQVALAEGRWVDARFAFEAVLVADSSCGEACFGLAGALWWLGENRASVASCTRAYALLRAAGDVAGAVQCAVWLAITYKANFANFAAANGWLQRADRLLEPLEPGALHGWLLVARSYRLDDLEEAETLTQRAVDLARAVGDVDLELAALSQLGLIRVGQGETDAGFALLDESMAAVLAGERSTLDTVVYTCCDMLHACELASDAERAAQWCQVADSFVDTYGCPFLYAECRIFYGSVLVASGRWTEADRELATGVRITEDACPALHARALTRLASLRLRQGRVEDAEQLLAQLDDVAETEAEGALSRAALQLAKGDARAASASLSHRLRLLEEHRLHLAAGLDLLVDAHVATGAVVEAAASANRLAEVATLASHARLTAMADAARGRVASARGEGDLAVALLEAALTVWSRLGQPYEAARAQFDLGRTLAAGQPAVAVEHARRALAAFETLGAAGEADRAAALLRSLGVVARTGPKGVGVLTQREQEVLRLLGAGLSNPEIAERLHVSRKTASHHVSHILTKLNLRNRSEAAAFAASAR